MTSHLKHHRLMCFNKCCIYYKLHPLPSGFQKHPVQHIWTKLSVVMRIWITSTSTLRRRPRPCAASTSFKVSGQLIPPRSGQSMTSPVLLFSQMMRRKRRRTGMRVERQVPRRPKGLRLFLEAALLLPPPSHSKPAPPPVQL